MTTLCVCVFFLFCLNLYFDPDDFLFRSLRLGNVSCMDPVVKSNRKIYIALTMERPRWPHQLPWKSSGVGVQITTRVKKVSDSEK